MTRCRSGVRVPITTTPQSIHSERIYRSGPALLTSHLQKQLSPSGFCACSGIHFPSEESNVSMFARLRSGFLEKSDPPFAKYAKGRPPEVAGPFTPRYHTILCIRFGGGLSEEDERCATRPATFRFRAGALLYRLFLYPSLQHRNPDDS